MKGVVADGTLTFISAEGGAGKSWVAQAFCEGVHHGESVAGLDCAQGVALYVDAEMGAAMFADRLRSSGATGAEYEYIDAVGLDVSRTDDLAWLQGKIKQTGANLVVIDSFRRLTPSKAENDSDDMAPVVGSLAKLARDTGAAIVVIHHKGESEKLFRGSSAIQNQTDALFGLVRFEDDPEGPLRHLWCPVARGAKRPRYSSDAADVWLLIDEDTGAVDEGDSPDLVAHMTTTAESVLRQVIEHDILAALPAKTKSEIAGEVKRRVDDPTFRAVWTELRRTKKLVKESGSWVDASKKGGGAQNPRDPTTTTLFHAPAKDPLNRPQTGAAAAATEQSRPPTRRKAISDRLHHPGGLDQALGRPGAGPDLQDGWLLTEVALYREPVPREPAHHVPPVVVGLGEADDACARVRHRLALLMVIDYREVAAHDDELFGGHLPNPPRIAVLLALLHLGVAVVLEHGLPPVVSLELVEGLGQCPADRVLDVEAVRRRASGPPTARRHESRQRSRRCPR